MSDTITVIYEQGVLRPLLPLSLPENARIQVRIVRPQAHTTKALVEKQRVYDALMSAGLIERHSSADSGNSISEQELAEAARVLGMAGPISDVIMAERAESY